MSSSTASSPQHDPVRWGILGAGSIAERFASDATAATGTVVVAVAAREGERARAFATRHNIAVAHDGYAALLADSTVEMVYIATPHSLHVEHALAAIRAGKSVLVEKPFTTSAADAERIRDEARTHGVFAMEGLWSVCNPVVQRLRDRIDAGAIGTPLAVTANVGPMGLPVSRGSGTRLEDPSLGASFMLEALVYPLWLSTVLIPSLAEPRSLTAAATYSDAGIDETASILLTGADGAIASLSGGIAFSSSGGPRSLLQITGSSGWAELSDDLFDPQSARLGNADGIELIDSDSPSRGFAWEIEEAGRSLRAGLSESALVPLQQSVQVMRILDAARRSATTLKERTSA